MEDIVLDDLRMPSEFKMYTFSNYRKCEVKKELIVSLKNMRIETSCYWSAEMLSSGYLSELWDILILFYSKFIHIGNVKLCIIFSRRLAFFKTKMKGLKCDIDARNVQSLRKMFSELVTLLCMSKQKITLQRVEILSAEFDLTQIKDKLKAHNLNYFTIDEDDSNELLIPLNELAFCIESKNTQQAFYWIEWILEYETRCAKAKSTNLKLARRQKHCPLTKYQKHAVWIIWEVFQKLNVHLIPQEVWDSCLNLFLLNYSATTPKKKIYLLFFVCSLLCEHIDYREKVLDESVYSKINIVQDNLQNIYKKIKRQEKNNNPENKALLKKVRNDNYEQSMNKMETLLSFKPQQISET